MLNLLAEQNDGRRHSSVNLPDNKAFVWEGLISVDVHAGKLSEAMASIKEND